MRQLLNCKRHIFIIVTVFIIFSLRLLFIDSDISTPWGMLNYQPIDEGIYANLALNKINFGSINPNTTLNGKYEYLMQPHVIVNIFGNTIVYIGLKLFGDNFLGFRVGSIFISFITTIIIYFTLNNIIKENCFNKRNTGFFSLILPVLTLYFSLNFVYYNASRLVEPTIYRMFFLTLVLFIFSYPFKRDGIKAFLCFFLITLSIFLVYITNTFIILAFIFLFFYWLVKKDYKKIKLYIKYGCVGIILAYLIACLYYIKYWDTLPLKNLIDCIYTFSKSSGYIIESTNKFLNILAFISSNIFLYNPLLIFGLIWSIFFIIKQRDSQSDTIILSLFLVLSMFIQTLVSEDYIVRKSLIILPSIMILILYTIYNFLNILIKNQTLLILNSFCSLITLIIITYRFYFINNGTKYDFAIQDKLLIFFELAGIYICIFLMIHKKNDYKKLIYLSFFIIVCNLLFIIKYNWLNQTYYDKTTMIELKDIAGEAFVLGEYINGYTLYNDIKPILNSPDKLLEYISKDHNLYYFDYSDFNTYNLDPNYLNFYLKNEIQFPRQFMTFGQCKKLALFSWRE